MSPWARLVLLSSFWLAAGPALAQQEGEDAPPPPAAPPKVVLTPEAEAQLSAADKERAKTLKREATLLFRDGRYKEAIEKFRQAHEITQDVDLLYSIAVSYQQLEAWQECVNFMERYLEKAPVGPKRDRAENTRTSCDARIERDQQLIIDTDPPGAKVYLDDRDKASWAPRPSGPSCARASTRCGSSCRATSRCCSTSRCSARSPSG